MIDEHSECSASPLPNPSPARGEGLMEHPMAEHLRPHRPRLGARRLCRGDPGGAAGPEDRDRRAREARRHLPQLGVHPDQGAAALGRDLPPHASMPKASACRRARPAFDLAKVVARSRGVAKQLNQGVTHLMKKNKIAVHMGEGKLTAPGKMTRHRATARRPSSPPSTSSSPPARARASCRSPRPTASASGPIATR